MINLISDLVGVFFPLVGVFFPLDGVFFPLVSVFFPLETANISDAIGEKLDKIKHEQLD